MKISEYNIFAFIGKKDKLNIPDHWQQKNDEVNTYKDQGPDSFAQAKQREIYHFGNKCDDDPGNEKNGRKKEPYSQADDCLAVIEGHGVNFSKLKPFFSENLDSSRNKILCIFKFLKN